MRNKFLFLFIFVFLALAATASAHIDTSSNEIYSARVLEVVTEETRIVEGTDVKTTYQVLRVEILEGPQKGEIIELEDDFLLLVEGDKFFVRAFLNEQGETFYTIEDFDRRPILYIFIGLFVLAVLVLGRMHGLRSLLALGGSLFVIAYFLLPQVLAGHSPLLLSAFIAVVILIFAIYATHGINRTSNAALLGTIISVFLTIILAYVAVNVGHLSGFTDDTATFLNLQTKGELDFSGLLLGAIIIGVLGVLDDISVTQASTVYELHHAAPKLSRKEIYKKAINVGRHHVGALVNTLALAYTGAALPLLLLFSNTSTSMDLLINREIFATEIFRTLVGSIGIVLAVPITTILAVVFLIQKTDK